MVALRDDIAAVVKKNEIENVLSVLNSQFESIKFTYEIECDKKLAFLDMELQNVNNKIEIGVYHKPTSTKRTITSDSHCCIQHKHAAFHSMVHRLCRMNLSVNNYMHEYKYIKEVARINGYDDGLIDVLIKKDLNKIERFNSTSFYSESRLSDEKLRIALPYVPQITNKLKSKFREHNLDIVYTNQNKLMNMLGSTKDATDSLQKSGIYSITCGDCGRKYYGQTKRSVLVRFKEHQSYIKYNQEYRSAIASHALQNDHLNVQQCNLKLVKQISDEKKLDAYESYYIQKDSNAINLDNGNVESHLIARLF